MICPSCDGDRRVEVAHSNFRMDADSPIWKWEDCKNCLGTGLVDPEEEDEP